MATLDGFSIIKLFKRPNYNFEVMLKDGVYNLEFIENFTNNSVTLNIYDKENKPVLFGLKVVAGLNLLAGVTVANKPKGSLILLTRALARDLVVDDDLDGVYFLYSEEYYDDFFNAVDLTEFRG